MFTEATYESGMKILEGDSVLLEHGKTPGVVVDIIITPDEQASFNVSEPGVMLKSPPFGLVFWPVSHFNQDPIMFVKRNET